MNGELSSLVGYLNHLEQTSPDPIYLKARHELDALIHSVVNHPKSISAGRCDVLLTASREIDRSYENLIRHHDLLKKHVRNLVIEQESQYFAESLRHFHEESCLETVEYKLSRQLKPNSQQTDSILGKLLRYAKWQVPGMIVGPGRDVWIKTLVALDPLYLVDTDLELLNPAYRSFTQSYQRRLRLYEVTEELGAPILHQLPQKQFGFCFLYNFFNYRPIEIIDQWLEEIHALMRPGGVLFFTFNDCDQAHGVALAESGFMNYTPSRYIRQKLLALQFDIQEHYHGPNDIAWIEAKVPGEITSLRGGQVLAKIVANQQ